LQHRRAARKAERGDGLRLAIDLAEELPHPGFERPDPLKAAAFRQELPAMEEATEAAVSPVQMAVGCCGALGLEVALRLPFHPDRFPDGGGDGRWTPGRKGGDGRVLESSSLEHRRERGDGGQRVCLDGVVPKVGHPREAVEVRRQCRQIQGFNSGRDRITVRSGMVVEIGQWSLVVKSGWTVMAGWQVKLVTKKSSVAPA
jgi:hypothetical protein